MTIEIKSRMRATAPVRSSAANRRVINSLHGEAKEFGENRHECWVCSNSSRWPDQCEKLAAMSVDERMNVVKKIHACFSCLKKTGREHRQANCCRRKQCTKVEGGRQCDSTHHPLLHKSNTAKVGVAVVAGT